MKLQVDYRGDVYVADMLFPQDPPDLDVVTLNSKEKELVGALQCHHTPSFSKRLLGVFLFVAEGVMNATAEDGIVKTAFAKWLRSQRKEV